MGIDRETGEELSRVDAVRQSVLTILTTPIGTRVRRREFGSRLYELVDGPLTPALLMMLYVATVEAIDRWEPDADVVRVRHEVRVGAVAIWADLLVDGVSTSVEVELAA